MQDDIAQDQGESFVGSEGVAEAQAAPVESPAPEQSGGHPAWQEILDAVPAPFHDRLRPTLEKWDKGVQEKLESVRGEWTDYGFLREQKVEPQAVQYALGLMQALQSDPRAFYNSIGEYYKFAGVEPVEAEEPEYQEGSVEAQLAQMKKDQEVLARALYERMQREKEASEDAALEREMTSLKQKYGDYDEQYVLGLMAQGQDGESAVRAYKELERRLRGSNGQATPAPRIMGSGGAAPTSGTVDPKKLDAKSRKDLVAQMLQHAARQGA